MNRRATAIAIRGRRAGGFTLLELLVSLAMGSVLVGAVASTVGAHIRSGLSMELSQVLSNDMSRLTYFLETEISEGESIRYGQPISGCAGVSGNALFSILVPDRGATGTTLPSTTIDYYLTGSGNTATLNRCGPPINGDGRLDFTAARIAAPVSTNTTLTLANTTDTKTLTYNITLRDPSATRSIMRSAIATSTRVTLIN
jgi:prepilin-type N-terminal cleavage/methylation domain-containing protein